MTLVSTVTVGAGGTTFITFSSVPQTGTDLLILLSARCNIASVPVNLYMNFNNDGGSNATDRWLRGSGSAATSGSDAASSYMYIGWGNGNSATSSTFSNQAIYIPNYTGSTTKSVSVDVVSENNATAAYQHLVAGLWNQTSAITTVKVLGDADFMQGTTASLYTITKGSGGATVA